MSDFTSLNPAEVAAQEAITEVYNCIDRKQSFIFEAGAGAGKTYSLIQAVKYLIKNQGVKLLRQNQKIACITYTNVAREEIETRTDKHPVIFSATIHSFCWSLIKDFQIELRKVLPKIDKWNQRIEEYGDIGACLIEYDLGYPKIIDGKILLGHDDVILLTVILMEKIKFCTLLASRYPILFIDEYQDTNAAFVEALKTFFLDGYGDFLIGFFGDHWQKIYGTGCGKIEHKALRKIGKKANFRSVKAVVDCLNRMRIELPQEVSNPNIEGSMVIYHTNGWQGMRRTEAHWKDDLPAEVAHKSLNVIKSSLLADEWDFSPEKTKILMLTHNILATEQGYKNLASVFDRTEAYIKKEDPYIAFFADTVEPLCSAYMNRKFGEMFAIMKGKLAIIRTHTDKAKWVKDMDTLLILRETENIGVVIRHIKATGRIPLPENVERKEREFEKAISNSENEILKSVERTIDLKKVLYKEVTALTRFIEEETPFATQHGVKGAEFENVVVICGRGWNQYNFGQMLEWAANGVPAGKQDTYERNRNLFYVACSRPMRRLAVIFTQKLSDAALKTLETWFGKSAIRSLNM